ncbi:Sin3 associated polypeptide p18-domain-containing protein [Tricladium varicosporioides]|nr:Sin3 associated polypeptide p18-domain-containing protein [Hymenoscyphus varicosporioides]
MAAAPAKIDRQITTPFHLKLFYRNGGFHRLDEFNPQSELPAHVQIYTWQSCTLRELSHLLTSALPSLLPDPAIGTRLAFRLIFPDTRSPGPGTGPGRFMTKDLGSIIIGDGGPGILPEGEEAEIVEGGAVSGPLGGEPDKTLMDARFVIGDYVSCAILPPLANGNVAPAPGGAPRGGFGMGRGGGDFGGRGFSGSRENGFGFRGRGGSRGRGDFTQGTVPAGEWRRGERVPEGPSGGRGRGYGGAFGGGFGGGGRGRY